jgi:hypothetical protein
VRITLDFEDTLISWRVSVVDGPEPGPAPSVDCDLVTNVNNSDSMCKDLSGSGAEDDDNAGDDDGDAVYVNTEHTDVLLPRSKQSTSSAILNDESFASENDAIVLGKVVQIQSLIRMYLARRRYLAYYSSASQLQALFRMRTLRLKFLAFFQTRVSSCIKLQACFRMHTCRAKYIKQRLAAVKIQSLFRMFAQRKKFLTLLIEFRRYLF